MKTKSILILVVAITALFASCKKDEIQLIPSGNVTTQTEFFNDIQRLEVESLFKVYITTASDEESIVVEADNNLHSYIQIRKSNNKLIVKLDEDLNIKRGEATLILHINVNELKYISGAGVTEFYLMNGINTNNLEINLSGDSFLNGTINSDNLRAKLTGASDIEIAGSASELNIDVIGASNMKGYDFTTNYLNAKLEGASEVNLTVNENMDVVATGASSVYYKGNAIIGNQNLTGASQIVKVD